MRWRTPVAALVVVLGLCGYAALVVTIADWIPRSIVAETLFYLLAGLLWVYPAGRLIAWSGRDYAR